MKYAVQVNYRTHRGNASSRTFVVEANSEPEAVEIANGKARKHPNVQSIVGGDVVEVFSPAPTDWGKEAVRLAEMRGKAIAYLKANIETFPQMAVHVWANIEATTGGFDRVSKIGEDTIAVSCNGYGAQDIYDLPARDLFEVCESVQKAIAGGTGK